MIAPMPRFAVAILSCLVSLSLCACNDEAVHNGTDAVPDATPIDCQELTYDNFGQAFIEDYCLECHQSSLTGLDRKDAPDSINFDDYDLVFTLSVTIKAIAGTRPIMPPSFAMALPSLDERMKLVQWVDCGLP